MFAYSENIIRFIQEIKSAVKSIIAKEIGLKIFNDRFYDFSRQFSYPIKVVVFNHRPLLGYFDPEFYELGFHECLMHESKQELYDLIRHELAHYMTFIRHGEVSAHGEEFRSFCKEMGWREDVYRACRCLESENRVLSEKSGIFRKIQKLMALSASGNVHEAELAMLKAQELLLKHNIESLPSMEEEKMFLKRILKQNKESAKMRSIAKILETFFVNIVYNRSREYIYLEVLGSLVNVEIAEYVASFLENEMDRLWNQAKKHMGLKGAIAKNSFFLGIAKGYCTKIQALKKVYGDAALQGLMVIEKQLALAKSQVYPRLSRKRSSAHHCPTSSQAGELAGRELSINPAVKSGFDGLLLS